MTFFGTCVDVNQEEAFKKICASHSAASECDRDSRAAELKPAPLTIRLQAPWLTRSAFHTYFHNFHLSSTKKLDDCRHHQLATNLLRGRFLYCSAAETSQPHPTTAMRVSSTLILRASSGFSLGYMASRNSHYPLHSSRTPLLCHPRQPFSLWSLASIVKNKGAPRYPSLSVNFD